MTDVLRETGERQAEARLDQPSLDAISKMLDVLEGQGTFHHEFAALLEMPELPPGTEFDGMHAMHQTNQGSGFHTRIHSLTGPGGDPKIGTLYKKGEQRVPYSHIIVKEWRTIARFIARGSVTVTDIDRITGRVTVTHHVKGNKPIPLEVDSTEVLDSVLNALPYDASRWREIPEVLRAANNEIRERQQAEADK